VQDAEQCVTGAWGDDKINDDDENGNKVIISNNHKKVNS
jgi:hypothetical protein